MASGLYYYLRHYCDSQATWGVDNTGNHINVPKPLPTTGKIVRTVKTVPYSYYMNVCTVSYSMAWWNWTRWERELDWMALHGVNFPLSFAGGRAVVGMGRCEARENGAWCGRATHKGDPATGRASPLCPSVSINPTQVRNTSGTSCTSPSA